MKAAISSTPPHRMLLTSQPGNSSVAEAYRMLRTSLLLAEDEAPARTILVTSTGRDEGKSLTCANLAIVLAGANQRVVIVDADLRLPTVHRLFTLGPGSYPQLLQEPAAAVRTSSPRHAAELALPVLDNLWVLPAGSEVLQPSELLASDRFAAMLRALAESFDVVLVDSPPVGLVTDAAVLAPQTDGVLFVVNFEASNRRHAQRALRTLHRVDAHVLGVVVNQYPDHAGETYGTPYGTPLGAHR